MVALSPSEVCGYLNQRCGSPYDPFHQRWNVSIPGNKPPIITIQTPQVWPMVYSIVTLCECVYICEQHASGSNKLIRPVLF